jgi:hypothetical protein
VIVPVPELAAHQVNGSSETYTGKFVLADDPDDLDGLTGVPRWTFGIIGSDGRLTSQGLAVPPIPPDYAGQMSLWKALAPDAEVIEGLSEPASGRTEYGLRIRTQTITLKPGLRHTASGFGTNWLPGVLPHLTAAPTNATPWMRFTFTAVELREIGGARWLAIDYLDEVHGECSKAFPWEADLKGDRTEVRASEYQGNQPGVRHQRIEYKMPPMATPEHLNQLRQDVEKALKQKSIRLNLGEKRMLFPSSLPGWR